jgi:hypothetical protein
MMDLLSCPDNSRIWIYNSDQKIADSLIPDIQFDIMEFTKRWSSHNLALRATGGILHNYFIILLVDEYGNKPGGCSIDSSIRFIKELSLKYNVDLFNRNLFYYIEEEEIKMISKDELGPAVNTEKIKPQTLFFDNLIQNKAEFQKSWLKPFQNSWHKNLL